MVGEYPTPVSVVETDPAVHGARERFESVVLKAVAPGVLQGHGHLLFLLTLYQNIVQ